MISYRFFGLGAFFAALLGTGLAAAQTAPPAEVAPPPPLPPPASAPTDAPAPPSPPVGAPYYQPQQQPSLPPEQPRVQGVIYVAQPPLPPIEPRTRYNHDGFYLRMSGGFGGLWTSSSADNTSAKASTSGSGVALSLMIGGTPAPGLVIGGGLVLQDSHNPSTSVSLNGTTLDRLDAYGSSLGFGILGPMVDVFPNPSGGFHFGGLLGLAGLGLHDDGKGSGGVGLSVWTGYMWWVSSQWSLGGLLQFSGAWTNRKLSDASGVQYDVSDSARTLNLSFSAAYH